MKNTPFLSSKLTTYCLRTLLVSIPFICTTQANAQTITTVAGIGTNGYSGDGGPATNATLYPATIAFDTSGSYFIGTGNLTRIRKVSPSGIISLVAGNGTAGFSGDGGQATAAQIHMAGPIAFDKSGNLYFSDFIRQRIRRVSTSGIINTVAGNGTAGYSGDGGPATAAQFNAPNDIVFDKNDNMFFTDLGCHGVRKVSASGIISTVAGTGTAGYSGDGGTAAAAAMHSPTGLALDTLGNLYVGDMDNNRIRKISTTGIITTIAGNGVYGSSGDGGPATAASLVPWGIVIDAHNNILVSDNYNHTIRRISTTGIITTIVGNGTLGYSGDGGPATAAQLSEALYFKLDKHQDMYIADASNFRVRKVSYSQLDVARPISRATTTIAVHPNPAGDVLEVTNSGSYSSYRLVNATGVIVLRGYLNKGSTSIQLSSLNQGVYVLEIINADGMRETQRVVKE